MMLIIDLTALSGGNPGVFFILENEEKCDLKAVEESTKRFVERYTIFGGLFNLHMKYGLKMFEV
ncbi:MAG: hypothetical protein ACI4L2_07070 [Wujia sp.]